MTVDPSPLRGIPSALTAIREFHRLRLRRDRAEPLTERDARVLSTIRDLFEPRVSVDGADREPLMITGRRRAAIRTNGDSCPTIVLGLALRVVHVGVARRLAPGEWLRIAIPRSPDGRWHRFRGRVLHVDHRTRRASIALVAAAGDPVPQTM